VDGQLWSASYATWYRGGSDLMLVGNRSQNDEDTDVDVGHARSLARQSERARSDEAAVPLDVLLIEDNAGDAELICGAFRDGPRRVNVEQIDRLDAGLRRVNQRRFDLVLLNLSLEDSLGFDAVVALCARAPSTPIIVMTRVDDEDIATQAVQAGAQDFLVKAQITRDLLFRSVRYAIDRQSLVERLRSLSFEDELTQVANRRGFLVLSHQQQVRARRTRESMLLFVADLDGFKHINDRLGHAAGDLALVDVASLLKHTFRDGDVVARLGGDEFAILANDARDETQLLTRLKANVDAYNAARKNGYELSLSVGSICVEPDTTRTVEELLADADAVMYERKRARKDLCHVVRGEEPSGTRRVSLG
jgi:diguanylate cyclase (GGDEF)-like protein